MIEAAQGESEIAVVELLSPTYDDSAHTATYTVRDVAAPGATTAFRVDELGIIANREPAPFEAAHLFIDGCPESTLGCNRWGEYTVSGIPDAGYGGRCWSAAEGLCLPCAPALDYAGAVAYWKDYGDQTFEQCDGDCQVDGICGRGSTCPDLAG